MFVIVDSGEIWPDPWMFMGGAAQGEGQVRSSTSRKSYSNRSELRMRLGRELPEQEMAERTREDARQRWPARDVLKILSRRTWCYAVEHWNVMGSPPLKGSSRETK